MIHNGSIEIITSEGENYGAIITPFHPLEEGGKIAAGVKARTGVQLGAKTDVDDAETKRMGSSFYGRWSGNLSNGESVTVNIYRTEGGA